MPVPSSGQLRLRADIANEVDGSASGTDVSLGTLSNTAGFSEPDTMSEFYGYSSESAPTITYVSQSSTYTTITLTYDIDWGNTTSGNWGVYIDVYSGQNLGTSWYGTQNPLQNTGGGQPSGTTRYNLTITPTSQYYYNYFDYKLKVFAYNSVGTTQSAGNFAGYRTASVQAATSYSWYSADQSSYRGWKFEANYMTPNSTRLQSGSYFRSQVNHPQLGWYTTHQTNMNAGASNFTGSVYVQGINYNTSYNYLTTVADRTTATNGVYHRQIYPYSLSSGSRPNRRLIGHWKMNNMTVYGGAVNTFGIKHSNHSMTAVYPDYDNYSSTLVSAPSQISSYNGTYGWSGSSMSYNGTQHAIWENAGSSGWGGNFEISVVYS